MKFKQKSSEITQICYLKYSHLSLAKLVKTRKQRQAKQP